MFGHDLGESCLLPIRMYCQKIQDDEGYWKRIEEHIRSRTDARFTHGMCEDCSRTHQADEPRLLERVFPGARRRAPLLAAGSTRRVPVPVSATSRWCTQLAGVECRPIWTPKSSKPARGRARAITRAVLHYCTITVPTIPGWMEQW
jgi:hypothetical protein